MWDYRVNEFDTEVLPRELSALPLTQTRYWSPATWFYTVLNRSNALQLADSQTWLPRTG